ncbi:MAG: hypothetical protein V3S21_08505 [Xanthomonadales bacterium]
MPANIFFILTDPGGFLLRKILGNTDSKYQVTPANHEIHCTLIVMESLSHPL